MGYAPGGHAWNCRDKATRTFFNSCDIIFDESFTGHPFPTDSNDSDDEDAVMAPTLPSMPSLSSTNVPALAPAAPTSLSTETHCSECVNIPTAHGQLFQEQLTSDHE